MHYQNGGIYPLRLKAILRSRCPHCLHGPVFATFMKMHETCPVCDIKFEREDGYFMMSVFIGYIMAIAALLPIVIYLYVNDASTSWYLLSLLPTLLILSPVIFHYARIVWLHLDEVLDPRQET
jgi:uncharacterized protein (DUF983 family)